MAVSRPPPVCPWEMTRLLIGVTLLTTIMRGSTLPPSRTDSKDFMLCPRPNSHIAAWHVWHVATVWTRVRLQTQATHIHPPSAASFAMNSTSGRWFINPCSSSQRGRPCKGVCLFVLRETWWKKRWFISDRMRKQMDGSWSIWLPVVMEYGLFLLTVLYVQVWCWLPMWASGPCHSSVPLFKMKRPLVDSMTMWHPK